MLVAVRHMDLTACRVHPRSHPARLPLLQVALLVLRQARLNDLNLEHFLEEEGLGEESARALAMGEIEQEKELLERAHRDLFCYQCRKKVRIGPELLRCARCGVAGYCGQPCQKRHWPQHKAQCKTMGRLRTTTL